MHWPTVYPGISPINYLLFWTLVHSLDESFPVISLMYGAGITHWPAWLYYVSCLMLVCGFRAGIKFLFWLSIVWSLVLQAAATSVWLRSAYLSCARSRITACITPVRIQLWALGKFPIVTFLFLFLFFLLTPGPLCIWPNNVLPRRTLFGIPVAGEILARCNGDYWGLITFVICCYAVGLICCITVKIIHLGWRRCWAIYWRGWHYLLNLRIPSRRRDVSWAETVYDSQRCLLESEPGLLSWIQSI